MKLFAPLKTKFVVWVWNHTPSCAEMSRLTSRAMEQPLSLRMRLKMRLHFVICAWCRRYFEQINFLRLAAHEHERHEEALPPQALSREIKNRMRERLKSANHNFSLLT